MCTFFYVICTYFFAPTVLLFHVMNEKKLIQDPGKIVFFKSTVFAIGTIHISQVKTNSFCANRPKFLRHPSISKDVINHN